MSGDVFLTWCFIYLTGFGALGVLWFRVVRPILEAIGLIQPYTQPADYVSGDEDDEPETTATTDVSATDTAPLRSIATPRNDDNGELSRNGGNLMLRARAEQIARLLKADSLFVADGKGGYKKAGQVLLIRLATGLEPNGRAESEYGQLRAELRALLEPQLTISAGRPEERIIPKKEGVQ